MIIPLLSRVRHGLLSAGKLTAVVLLITAGVAGQPAHATFTIQFGEVAGGVVATGSGTLNTSAFSNPISNSVVGPLVEPNLPALLLGGGATFNLFSVSMAGAPFGTGGLLSASSGSGDPIGFQNNGVALPVGYVSGTFDADSAFWSGSTFSSLGLTSGIYTESFGSGSTADAIVVEVPEPGTLVLLAGALAALGLARRRYG